MLSNLVINKQPIYCLSYTELMNKLISWGYPKYRTQQIWRGIYKSFWYDPEQFSTLPHRLRSFLAEHFTFTTLEPINTKTSSDGNTTKTLFQLEDNHAIETVLMRYKKRNTVCISTQAGCGMGCIFCATGQMGLRRNLSSGEIVEQVLFFARKLQENYDRITNIVFMGMGEPFHNYESTMKAVDILNDSIGFKFGARRMTISTVGLVKEILRFASEKRQVNLAISLHAAEDELRDKLLPINKRYPIADLLDACLEYVRETRRRITFEWAMIRGVNDSLEQALKLVKLLDRFRLNDSRLCHVNIIQLNPSPSYNGVPTRNNQARLFLQLLRDNQISCTLRLRRGVDIQAGCGQLVVKS